MKERIIRRAVKKMFKWISELCTCRLQDLEMILIYYGGLLFYNCLDLIRTGSEFYQRHHPGFAEKGKCFPPLLLTQSRPLEKNTSRAKTRTRMDGLYLAN